MKLYPHQVKALEQTKGLKRVAYFLDMGLGKTFVGSEKMNEFDADTVLVICQKSKIGDWINHFFTHYIVWDDFDEEGSWCYDLTNRNGMDMFFHSRYKRRIGVINYDLTFRRPELLKLEKFTLILDESSLIQNEKAKRSKFVLKLTPENVIELSGTPTSGKYEKLWSQVHLLGWNIGYACFQRQYVNWTTIDMGGVPLRVVDKENPYKNVERLKQKLREHGAIFMKTEECFDLPEQTFIDVLIDASREYRAFQTNRIVFVDNAELVGDTPLKQRMCERQLCGMYSREKLQAFKDLLSSTEDRVIVFYNFNEELERLKEIIIDLERPFSQVNGHVKDTKAYEEADNSVTLIQYQAGAMGLDFQKANKVIYFTLPLMSELFEQSKKRTHRIGQTRPCFYYILTVKNSVECRIKETLEMRKDYTDDLFELVMKGE